MTELHVADVTSLSYALGKPEASGLYKVIPEDFMVEEQIAFELSGEGEHLWCWVEKRGENTDWVLQQLAKWAGVSPAKVNVAGQKDRHAVTRQWFSIQLAGRKNPCVKAFDVENVQILNVIRHQRKLQTGGLSGNRFTLTIRNIEGGGDFFNVCQTRLEALKTQGVPNYFGAQRFGLYGRNIKQGLKLLAGELPKVKRNQKSLYLSALRSWMFNVLLSQRIDQGSWNQLLLGDVLQLQGSNKWFLEDGSSDLSERIAQLDLHPTGALYGKGALPTEQEALAVENHVAGQFSDWISGLDQYGVQQGRRALRVLPMDLTWQWKDERNTNESDAQKVAEAFERLGMDEQWKNRPALQLSFTLRSGSYATMVLRELLLAEDYQMLLKEYLK